MGRNYVVITFTQGVCHMIDIIFESSLGMV